MKYVYLILLIVNQFVMYSQDAPQPVDFPELGVKFIIPAGWTGQQYEDYILLGHTSIPGMLLLFENTSKTAEALKETAELGINENGLYLKAIDTFTITSEKSVEGYYEGSYDGANVKAFGKGLLNPHGNGLSLLVLTTPEKFSETHISEVQKISESVVFSKAKDTDNTAAWKKLIVGYKLKYMYTSSSSDYGGGYSGISDVITINLYTDATFSFYSNSHASFDNNSGSANINSNEDTTGVFKIYSEGKSTYLELNFLNGKSNSYELSRNEKKNILLNGTRYFLTTIE